MNEVLIKAEQIRDVFRYLRLFENSTLVFHIDDNVIDSAEFHNHIRDICLIHEAGLKVIIVPAARKRIDEILKQSNIDWTINSGCRITDESAMPLIKMAAFDVANKVMTALAAEKHTAVIGNWVRSRGKGIRDGIDFGTSGEIDKIEINSIKAIFENGFIPIFPCIGWSITGKPYNISSLQLATAISVKLNADKLLFLTEGISISNKNSIVPKNIPLSKEGNVFSLNLKELPHFIEVNEAKSTSPQIPQIINLCRLALNACRAGVSRVHILNGSINGSIPCEIFSDFGSGTMIYEDNYGGIRSMTLDDIPAVLNLIKPFVESSILLPRTAGDLSDHCEDYIVYELDDQIRACSALHMYDDKQAEIAAVAVDSNYSNLGVGPKMVNYLIERAKSLHAKSVFVLTTQSADWFETLGFSAASIDTLPKKRREKWSEKRGSKLLKINL